MSSLQAIAAESSLLSRGFSLLVESYFCASVLLLIAMIAVWAGRRSSAGLRHWLLSITLASSLALSGLLLLVPSWNPLSFTTSLPSGSGAVEIVNDHAPSSIGSRYVPEEQPVVPNAPVEIRPPETGSANPEIQLESALAVGRDDDRRAEARAAMSGRILNATTIRLSLLMLWAAGALVVMAREMVAHVAVARSQRRAEPITDQAWSSELAELSERLHLMRSVRLLVSPDGDLPAVTGIRRPAILLPGDYRDWSPERRRLVLLHELAHVIRHDLAWQVIAKTACAVYWLQPLSWIALRALRKYRERACDDLVLTAGTEASGYAATLLDFSRRCTRPRLRASLAMAQGPELEHRVAALFRRDVSHRPIGSGGRWGLVATILFAAVIVTVTRPLSSGEGSKLEIAAGAEQPGPVVDDSNSEPHRRGITIVKGRVLDPSGKPARAKVLVVRTDLSEGNWDVVGQEVLERTSTRQDGSFTIDVPTDNRARFTSAGEFIDARTHAVAMADGFGPDSEYLSVGYAAPLQLRLAPDEIPIRGRLVDEQGRPIVGAQVRVTRVMRPDGESVDEQRQAVDEWVAKARDNPKTVEEARQRAREAAPKDTRKSGNAMIAHFPSREYLFTRQANLFQVKTTDQDGRFELKGIGTDHVAELEIEADGFAKSRINVVAREMDPVPLPRNDRRFPSNLYFGTRFEFACPRGWTLRGTLRDAESEQPIAGADVWVDGLPGHGLVAGRFITDTTNAQGQFVLAGIPLPTGDGQEMRLQITPADADPYFLTDIQVRVPQHLPGDSTTILELRKARWMSGQVVEEDTRRPVPAIVRYLPFRDNEAATAYASFSLDTWGVGLQDARPTNLRGEFRIPVLPGRGLVVAVAHDRGSYRWKDNSEAIEGLLRDVPKDEPGFPLNVYHLTSLNEVHAVTDVTLDVDDPSEPAITLTADRLPTATVRLIGSQGEPIRGVDVAGQKPLLLSGMQIFWSRELTSSEFMEVSGEGLARVTAPRPVVFLHRTLQLGRVVSPGQLSGTPDKLEDIELLPLAEVTGQLVDEEGNPFEEELRPRVEINKITDGGVQIRGESPRADNYTLRDAYEELPNGRFRLRLPPGATYTFLVYHRASGLRAMIAEELTAEPGEKYDLGQVVVKLEVDSEKPLGLF